MVSSSLLKYLAEGSEISLLEVSEFSVKWTVPYTHEVYEFEPDNEKPPEQIAADFYLHCASVLGEIRRNSEKDLKTLTGNYFVGIKKI